MFLSFTIGWGAGVRHLYYCIEEVYKQPEWPAAIEYLLVRKTN